MTEEFILEEEAIVEERTVEGTWLGEAILDKPIRSLPGLPAPISVPSGSSVRLAVERMNEHRIGCVLVEEHGRLIGIFTERDVLTRAVGTGVDIDSTKVDTVMTVDPECLT